MVKVANCSIVIITDISEFHADWPDEYFDWDALFDTFNYEGLPEPIVDGYGEVRLEYCFEYVPTPATINQLILLIKKDQNKFPLLRRKDNGTSD